MIPLDSGTDILHSYIAAAIGKYVHIHIDAILALEEIRLQVHSLPC